MEVQTLYSQDRQSPLHAALQRALQRLQRVTGSNQADLYQYQPAREKPSLHYTPQEVALAFAAATAMENARLQEDMRILLGQAQSIYNITLALL